ncbi:MAG: SusD/RagB family nutrient-binding outer membrane lipoprotein [Mangrovibacterium sp.]
MKTRLSIKIAAALSGLFLIMNACTDNFQELNTPVDLLLEDNVNVDMMFTQVIASLSVQSSGAVRSTIANYSGMAVQGDNRPFQEGDAPGVWNATYGNYGRNLSDIIHICQKRDTENGDQANTNKIAIARILKAYVFARCTDVYGNIPYSESCLPLEEAVYQPKYDLQKDIYTDLFKELKEAVAQLTSGETSYDNADILYKGDITKWAKFGNSLRLRLALRVRYVDPEMARSNMNDLSLSNLISDPADDAIAYTNTQYTDWQNDLYTDLVERKHIVVKREIGKTMLDILIGNGDAHHPADPRTKLYADTAMATFQSFGYRGRPLLGQCPVQQQYPYSDESVSKWSDLLFVAVIERSMYRSPETYFNLAEAALFGLKGTSVDAQTYYKKGIELAMANAKAFYVKSAPQLPEVINLFHDNAPLTGQEIAERVASKEITQEEIDDFLANNPVITLTGTNEEKLEQIINQKMVAFFPNDYEAWADYRRTGYPRILIGNDADDLHGQIPRRMPWPTNEQTLNGTQYDLALKVIGGEGKDNRLTRFWWDANPNPVHPHPGTVEWREHPWQ